MGGLFCKAFSRATTIEKAVDALKPYDPEVFTTEDFAPAMVTDRPLSPSHNISESIDKHDIPLNKLIRSSL